VATGSWLLFSCFFFSSRRRHTRWPRDWSSDVCSSDLGDKIKVNVHFPDITPGGGGKEKKPKIDPNDGVKVTITHTAPAGKESDRSEERRVGKECRCRESPNH